jgi:hypothetical protein
MLIVSIWRTRAIGTASKISLNPGRSTHGGQEIF